MLWPNMIHNIDKLLIPSTQCNVSPAELNVNNRLVFVNAEKLHNRVFASLGSEIGKVKN